MDSRERIGKITTSGGDVFDVFLLKLRDVTDIDFAQKDFMFQLAARSIGVPYDEFLDWDIVDSIKVVSLVGNSYKTLGAIK